MPPLQESLQEWESSTASIFHIPSSSKAEPARALHELDVLEREGTAVIRVSNMPTEDSSLFTSVAWNCMLDGFDEVRRPNLWEPLGRWQLKRKRVILYIDWESGPRWEVDDLMEAIAAGARIIIAKPRPLPEFKDVSISSIAVE
jgi:hypothetical protein